MHHGIANHDIYRHVSSSRAAQDYRSRRVLEFSEGMGGPWTVPAELTYRSPIADQYHVACGMQTGTYMCKLVAQYEEYYVFFNVHMDDEAMTFSDLERALRAIDEKMATCLKKPLTPPAPTTAAR